MYFKMPFGENIASKENRVEDQIETVLKNSNNDLSALKDLVLTGNKLNADFDLNVDGVDAEITKDHVINILESVKDKSSYDQIYAENAAGIIFAVQYLLNDKYSNQLGKIDGVYGDKTKSAIKAFQESWNIEHNNDLIDVDGVAGLETIKRILKDNDNINDLNSNSINTVIDDINKKTQTNNKADFDIKENITKINKQKDAIINKVIPGIRSYLHGDNFNFNGIFKRDEGIHINNLIDYINTNSSQSEKLYVFLDDNNGFDKSKFNNFIKYITEKDKDEEAFNALDEYSGVNNIGIDEKIIEYFIEIKSISDLLQLENNKLKQTTINTKILIENKEMFDGIKNTLEAEDYNNNGVDVKLPINTKKRTIDGLRGVKIKSLDLQDVPINEFDYFINNINFDNLKSIDNLSGLSEDQLDKFLKKIPDSIERLDLGNTKLNDSILNKLNLKKFKKLTSLDVNETEITKLDVSSNTLLEYLNFSYTGITKLDVSKNTLLKYLNCSVTGITKLDVSKTNFYQSNGEDTYAQKTEGLFYDMDNIQVTFANKK